MQVELLTLADERAYEEILQEREDSILYTSLKFRNLLRESVSGEALYLIARQGEDVLGALPLFLKRNHTYGSILNSLPFYGSNGGVLVSKRVKDKAPVFKALFEGLRQLACETDTVAATIITSPFESRLDLYEDHLKPAFRDSRVGQIAVLPQGPADFEDAVMDLVHSKTRNMVRKARKSGMLSSHTSDSSAMRFLAHVHQENIRAVGGIAKSQEFFRNIQEIFEYDRDYRLYVATRDRHPVSALLVFYYNRTVEYYTPATLERYRSLQPGSLLIFEAMKDAAERGYRYWNFGGTWQAQHRVYHFKKRWGARDRPYYYYVATYRNVAHLLKMEPCEILKAYPSFYVVPFHLINREAK